jgi:hypothetical protein
LKEKESARGGSSEFDGETFLRNEISYDELAGGKAYYLKVFNSVTPLRVMRSFLEALNFSLNDYSFLMLLLVKNEALEQFL